MPDKKKIFIGIPCYQSAPAETLEDYMRFAYHLGRRMPEFDFVLGIKPKSEQFRARNAIVEGALQSGCDYLFMLDDDHVISWDDSNGPTLQYDFLKKLVEHNKPIVGALYYHRGGECLPVIMKEGNDGGFYYMREDEVKGELQEVAVTGGGAMLIDMNVFSRIPSPWFEPEFKFGTDVQICKKAREAGFSVYCDTSIVLGHVKSSREVVSPKTRLRIMGETAAKNSENGGVNQEILSHQALALYRMDAEEYLKMPFDKMGALALAYQQMYDRFKEYDKPEEYYKALGPEQIARQVWFHHQPFMVEQMKFIHSMINGNVPARGIDFGCGSAPVSFELALKGHSIDFVDLDGTPAYGFTKWRAERRGIADRCGWTMSGPYDYAMCLDSIEHIKNWEEVLENITSRVKDGGFFVTNFFLNEDYANLEHINMDKKGVREFLIKRGFYPINQLVFVKRDLGFMDKKEDAKNEHSEKDCVLR